MKACSVQDCERPHLAKGFCVVHYQRTRKGLDLVSRKKAPAGAPLSFLYSLVGSTSVDCIYWPYAGKDDGYGKLTVFGKQMAASRAMCIIAHGEPLIESMHAAHNCGKGHLACVNPNHLSWKTCLENERDKISHGTKAIGARNKQTKLCIIDVLSIKEGLSSGISGADLARQFSVNRGTISTIKSGRSWSYVKVGMFDQ